MRMQANLFELPAWKQEAEFLPAWHFLYLSIPKADFYQCFLKS